MQFWSGVNSRDHGFHDEWPVRPPVGLEPHEDKAYKRQLQLAITEKLDLIHSEISEALEELRKGHDPLKVYYSQTFKHEDREVIHYSSEQEWEIVDGVRRPLLKPEGFIIELADAVIRIGDLVYLLGGDLEGSIAEKHDYNRTRPYKHGKKF
jgi:hypothetical protein